MASGRGGQDAASRARARWARYNASPKGRARRDRYEAAHPERRNRWDVIMRIRANAPPPA